uniref:Uncharacterized protein n=1 Tax=Rhizophora mucronata TaxID=61149 RepID=A0A2P2N3P1_RHIMU
MSMKHKILSWIRIFVWLTILRTLFFFFGK